LGSVITGNDVSAGFSSHFAPFALLVAALFASLIAALLSVAALFASLIAALLRGFLVVLAVGIVITFVLDYLCLF
jgi:hypothetical protein